MGDLFAVELRPHNRWGGFKALRERWLAHLEATFLRPVVLIDEAQEMHPAVLNELRLLTSLHFDSRTLLSVILAGDARLTNKLRREELLPLGSRIRTRLNREYASREALLDCLKHLQNSAGNASLMTAELMSTLAEHALGNYRVLTTMAAELLATAAQHRVPAAAALQHVSRAAAASIDGIYPRQSSIRSSQRSRRSSNRSMSLSRWALSRSMACSCSCSVSSAAGTAPSTPTW